ncbi:hypothetical protein L1987_39556 [Smallanthus sonchifolius]|uniref:Uncharacterized protein n=1 Tax=Smallanthus sonchifolius TaxID=185202 RepID=A0ACB9HNN8_9ASTR|nr:hypothetical protein L1987_39556 [Smallanthus sonchifolius]
MVLSVIDSDGCKLQNAHGVVSKTSICFSILYLDMKSFNILIRLYHFDMLPFKLDVCYLNCGALLLHFYHSVTEEVEILII